MVVLKSGSSSSTLSSTDWTGMLKGQEQSIPQSANSGGQFDGVNPAISCIASLQASAYVHEPTLNPWTIVHLTGKAKPATVLMISIVVGSLPSILSKLIALTSIVSVPGCLIG